MANKEVSQRHKKSCPVCGHGRILDEADRPDVCHVVLLRPEESDHADWFIKCQICKNQIGVMPIIK